MVKKKKNTSRFRFLSALLMMVILLVLSWYLLDIEKKGPTYDAFGISLPGEYAIHGIDISRYQQQINWKAVKSMRSGGKSLSFAFIKATEGVNQIDRRFEFNWNRADAVNMVKGAYHYFLPNRSGLDQANHFIETVALKAGDLPPVVDVEITGGKTGKEICSNLTTWINRVESYYGVKPIIYTNVRFYEQYLADDFSNYPLWIAHYLQPDRPRIVRDWLFWQHSESGRVNGIGTKVDFNVFNGDSSDFRKVLIQ